MIKLGMVRGYYLCEYEALYYSKLKKYGVEPVGIATKDNFRDLSNVAIPIRKLNRIGMYNKLPIVSRGIQYFLRYDDYLLNFKKAISDFDILHAPEPMYPFSYQSAISGKPCIFTCAETIPFNKQRHHAKFTNVIFQKAKHFTPLTELAKKVLLIEGIEEERISVIPFGVDTEVFSPTNKDETLFDKYNLNRKGKFILYISRLDWSKGIFDLIYVMKNIIKNDKKVYLLIGGSGNLKNNIVKLCKKLNIENNVIFLGQNKYLDTVKWYNLCDIVVMPSLIEKYWNEQFGMILIESMSCEKPLITTYSSIIPEVVEDKALLFSPASLIELEEKIKILLNDADLRKKMGKEGRKFVIKKYEANKIAKRLSILYKKILNG